MPKAYRKPHITMNRPKYPNKVRVARQSKALPKFQKPSVLDLKRIYSKLAKVPVWDRPNILSEAVQWYRTVMAYAHNIAYVKTRAGYSTAVAKAITRFYKILNDATSVNLENSFIEALKSGQYIAKAYGISAPSPDSYLKKAKLVAKKIEKKEKESTTKYDKILTLLAQATASAEIELKVSPILNIDRKFDRNIKTMFYSTKCVKALKQLLYQQGLLAVVLQEAWHLAHAKSFEGNDEGVFIPSPSAQGIWFMSIMKDFENWSRTSQYAPKSLVRRHKPKKKDKIAA